MDVQRPLRVILAVEDGDYFGGDRLQKHIAFNSRWSWSNLLQYDNTAEIVGINSRLRYIPEAGREMVFVLNHGSSVSPENHLSSTQNDLNLKLSYTFRY